MGKNRKGDKGIKNKARHINNNTILTLKLFK